MQMAEIIGSNVYALGISEKLGEAMDLADFPDLEDEDTEGIIEWVAETLARNQLILEEVRRICATDVMKVSEDYKELHKRINELKIRRDYLLQKSKIKGIVI